MIKKVVVTLLVEVDTEDEYTCPSGDPLQDNVVLNVINDDYFLSPVSILGVSHLQTLLWATITKFGLSLGVITGWK